MAGTVYGYAARLEPPITIDGKQYSVLIRFYNFPSLHSDNNIVGGKIASVIDLGGGYKKIVCAKGTGYFSQTHVLESGNSWEELVAYLKGGNIVSTPEPARGPGCYADPGSHSGPDTTHRAQLGDVLYWNNRAFLITGAKPYAVVPEEINWQGEGLHRIERLTIGANPAPDTHKWFDFRLEDYEAERAILGDDGSGLFDETGAQWEDTGVESGNMARKIWEESEDYFPADARLGFAEYFMDRIHWRLIFPSVGAQRSGDGKYWFDVNKALITWYASGINAETYLINTDCIVFQGAGASLNNFATLFSEIEREDPFAAHEQELCVAVANGDGSGLQWRKDYSPGSPFIAWEITSAGAIILKYRLVQDGEVVSSAVSGTHPPSLIITFKFEEAFKGQIKCWWREGSGAWILQDTIVLDLSNKFYGGVWAIAGAGLRCIFADNWSVVRHWVGARVDGIFSRRIDLEEYLPPAGNWYWKHHEPWEDLLSIHNETTGEDMIEVEEGADIQRNTFVDYGGDLYFGCEAFGDIVRATYEGDVASEPPGRHPGGPKNFGEGGEGTGQNIGNWNDQLTIYDPDNKMTATEGEEFEIKRNGFGDPRETFKIYYDEAKNGEMDFTQVPDINIYRDILKGFGLIEKTWADANIDPEKIYCWRGEFARLFQLNSVSPRYFNEMVECIQKMNTCQISVIGGSGMHISGQGEMFPVGTNRECGAGNVNYWKGWVWGIHKKYAEREMLRGWLDGWITDEEAAAGSCGRYYRDFGDFAWALDPPGIVYPMGWMGCDIAGHSLYRVYAGECQKSIAALLKCSDKAEGKSEYGAEAPYECDIAHCWDGFCGDDPDHPDDIWYEGDRGIAGGLATFLSNDGMGSGNFSGCWFDITILYGNEGLYPYFSFVPTAFNPDKIIKGLPKGAIINWARAQYHITNAWHTIASKPAGDAYSIETFDGVSEHLSFMLIKMLRDSRYEDHPCPGYAGPKNRDIYSLAGQGLAIGTGIGTRDARGIADISEALQALVEDHDSAYGFYFFFPSVGSGLLGGGGESFLRGLLPAEYGCDEIVTRNEQGKITAVDPRPWFSGCVMQHWDSLVIEKVIINFTSPNGIVEEIVIPYGGNALE